MLFRERTPLTNRVGKLQKVILDGKDSFPPMTRSYASTIAASSENCTVSLENRTQFWCWSRAVCLKLYERVVSGTSSILASLAMRTIVSPRNQNAARSLSPHCSTQAIQHSPIVFQRNLGKGRPT